ncbi:putative FAD dependent oxidoreductase [Colletotrichum sublineola]|uniref:Putative FAD dependent oxidoreductase n=1 Tax=Colletotrichum sublineola TaxID=1173701 RepID=A0A066XJT3_COLSU|nr:putative FAD dependent oxidoreductase [Colletotrichum sublineola]
MLDIAIIGGGIAGLTAAIALRRAGHTLTIYEKSALNNEIGAAINVQTNASRPLLALGMDPVRARFVTAKGSRRVMGDTLQPVHELDLGAVAEKYGSPWYFAHRVDLHQELKRMATADDGGPPITFKLRSEVTNYVGISGLLDGDVCCTLTIITQDPDGARFTLRDGTVVSADLVVVADGIHSGGVEAILGSPNPAFPAAQDNFCYRFLIPMEDVLSDPTTSELLDGAAGGVRMFLGGGKRIVTYPCRDGEVLNCIAIFHNEWRVSNTAGAMDEMGPGEERLTVARVTDWHSSVEKSLLLDRFSNFHPSVLSLLEKAGEVKQWPLLYRAPISTWRKGRMILIGDAAHPMLPHQGQGGAQAIEDGIALGVCFSNVTSEAEVPERLKVFEGIRRNRASAVTIFSNAAQDEAGKIREAASEFVPIDRIPTNPEDFYHFHFDYDIMEDAARHMKTIDPKFKLPESFLRRLTPLSISMFQDDFASDDSANVFEGYTGEEATEELHPAILAAIVIGCITAGFALLTWYLNSCVQFRRMRLRRRRDEEANDPPGGPNTLEQKPSDYIPNNNTLDGASERDREQSAPTSTRGTRRPEPIANPNRTASGPMHDSQSLPNTLPQTPVVLLGPLAVLGCFSMVQPLAGINDEASQIGRKPIVLAGAASRPQQNWYIEGG